MGKKIYKYDIITDELIRVKHKGQIFTPDYLVEIILNQGHYVEGNINKKHVIDNSCGDGQFMVHIVERYCKDFLQTRCDLKQLKSELETYIHAIELEKEELNLCIKRCSNVANRYGVDDVQWDFLCCDAIINNCYNGKMDFVVGNPPYVRVHNMNIDSSVMNDYLFSQQGMKDLYIIFYEIGIRMLNRNGILCYITPSSFFTSVAGRGIREYFINHKILESVCDLKHFQAFDAMAYTTIVCLNMNGEADKLIYYEFDETKYTQYFVERLAIEEYYINNCFYFSTIDNLLSLKKILQCSYNASLDVKNGYATLADKVFVNDFEFESKYIISALKASTGKWKKIIFPYDDSAKLVSENEIENDKELYAYLCERKDVLIRRDSEKKGNDKYWYAFGRSQAIKDTFKNKIGLNTMIRDLNDLKLVDVPSGSGVYSGLYIISDTIPYEIIKNSLMSKEFVVYIKLLSKYKSGGYYTFSSKDIKTYLNYKFGEGVY